MTMRSPNARSLGARALLVAVAVCTLLVAPCTCTDAKETRYCTKIEAEENCEAPRHCGVLSGHIMCYIESGGYAPEYALDEHVRTVTITEAQLDAYKTCVSMKVQRATQNDEVFWNATFAAREARQMARDVLKFSDRCILIMCIALMVSMFMFIALTSNFRQSASELLELKKKLENDTKTTARPISRMCPKCVRRLTSCRCDVKTVNSD